MAIDEKGHAYPGPNEPATDETFADPEADLGHGKEDDSSRNDVSDDPDMPVNLPGDEDEEPSA